MTTFMRDQSPRHDCSPSSAAAKLARARQYLAERNIAAVAIGSKFRYAPSENGSRVLRTIRRRAA